MSILVAMIQTTWPNIRVGLYQREDGRFHYIEEGMHPNDDGTENWIHYSESDLYDHLDAAKTDMVAFYCNQVEDEYEVEPQSVVVLEAPDFKGPHHPVLRERYPKDSKS